MSLLRAGVVFVVFGATLAMPASADEPPLTVRITSPSSGIESLGPVLSFEAEVSDAKTTRATMVVNGTSYEVRVEGGRIAQSIVAIPGNNRVGVVVARGREVARASSTFHYQGDPVEMIALLTWPSEGEIIDLWVREPSGETCKWDHRETATGGHLLDFSSDAIGFGSQAYMLPQLSAGRYRVKVHYWGAYASEDAHDFYAYDQMIGELDDLDARLRVAPVADRAPLAEERNALARRIDAWALSAGIQTTLSAEIITFPGTRHERRHRFDLVVSHSGELATLGEIEITDEMIREARAGR